MTRTSSSLSAEDTESCFAQADVVSQLCTDTHPSPPPPLRTWGKNGRGTCLKRMLCQLHHRSASARAEKGREHFCHPVPPFLPAEGESWTGAEFASWDFTAGGDASYCPQHRACKAQQASGARAEPISCSSAARRDGGWASSGLPWASSPGCCRQQ